MKASERKQNQEKFMAGELKTIVATNAFGMGIDKPDIRFVVHLSNKRQPAGNFEGWGLPFMLSLRIDVPVSRSGPVRSLHSDPACKQVTGRTKIGTCCFGVAQAEYARAFSCVEVQHTFYQPPQLTTLKRWRRQMPADFEFTLKAWQLITHDAKSPTYRRLKRKLSETEKPEAGYFRATAIVNEAWGTMLASAKALKAETILFQCPASFKQTHKNIASMEKFF